MDPTGSPFRRPPARPVVRPRRTGFGPVPAAPLTAATRNASAARVRNRGVPRESRARALRLGSGAFYLVAALTLLGAAVLLGAGGGLGGGDLRAGRSHDEGIEDPREACLVGPAVDAGHHLAALVDDHGVGRAPEAETIGNLQARIEPGRAGRLVGLEEVPRIGFRILDLHAHQLDAPRPVLPVDALERRRLLVADLAPRGLEAYDQHVLAQMRPRIEVAGAVEQRHGERGGRSPRRCS